MNKIGLYGCMPHVAERFEVPPGTRLVCLEEYFGENEIPRAYALAWLRPDVKALDGSYPFKLDRIITFMMDVLDIGHVIVERTVAASSLDATNVPGVPDDNDEDYDPYRRAHEFMADPDTETIVLVIGTTIRCPNGTIIAYIEKIARDVYELDELTYDRATPLDL